MEDFVVRSLSSLWFYFISCSKLIFPVLWAVTNITSGSVKEIQKCHFTFLISLVVWIHATAFGAWWHRFVSYGAVVCFLGKTQELSFLEKKKKQEVAERLNLPVRSILTSPGRHWVWDLNMLECRSEVFCWLQGIAQESSY